MAAFCSFFVALAGRIALRACGDLSRDPRGLRGSSSRVPEGVFEVPGTHFRIPFGSREAFFGLGEEVDGGLRLLLVRTFLNVGHFKVGARVRRDFRNHFMLPLSTGSSRSCTLQQFFVREKMSRDVRNDACFHVRVEVRVVLLRERFLARFLSRGRRTWPQASEIRRPRGGSGVVGL